jgi:hypothetical protein
MYSYAHKYMHGHPELQLAIGAVGMFLLGGVLGIVVNETLLDGDAPWPVAGATGGALGCIVWAVWQRHAYDAVD